MIKIPEIFSDKYMEASDIPANMRKNLCVICGKEVSGKNSSLIYLTSMVELVKAAEVDAHDLDYDLGYHHVGSECAKKIPAEYLIQKS